LGRSRNRGYSWPPRGLVMLGWLLYPYFPRAVVKLHTLSGGDAEYVEWGVRACFRETGAGEDSGALSVLALGGGGKEELVVVVSGDLRHYISTIDIMSSCRVAGVFCGDNVPSLDSHMSVALLSLLLSLVVIVVFPPARPAVWRSPHSSAHTH